MKGQPPDDFDTNAFASSPCAMHEVDPVYMGFADPGHDAGPKEKPMSTEFSIAPPIVAEHWFNASAPLSLENLGGKVVAVEAFQMLCPGCVSHGIPQAQRIHDAFSREDVVVLGLHTVFEHHAAMTPVALEAFLHEYKVSFPVAVDQPRGSGMPATMHAYQMQGTPTLLLIDKRGRLRKQWFGAPADLIVGAEVMRLVLEGT